jgi:conjugative transfer signal peptidase TraF
MTVAISALVALATRPVVKASRLHFNYSDSVPIGLYREVARDRGLFAGFCLPDPVIEGALAAGLQPIRGTCPGGVAPILKPLVQASDESPVVLSADGFRVAGTLVPNTAPKTVSRTGKLLAHYPFGRYASGLWAISQFCPDSYDSRYFGPVSPAWIQFFAKPACGACVY